MTDPLGLSVGMTNLVAARVGRPPILRRAVLTLFPDRPAEAGVPADNPNLTGNPGDGLVVTGFVERVGDPVPLVAADGSSHRGEHLLAEALDAMARTVEGGSPVAVAVPAHWGPGPVGALRGALREKPGLSPGGVPPALIPDAYAALTALQSTPGLPGQGVLVLCDFGGTGTGITLADATNLQPIAPTLRFPEFSGDQIDQALLNHVLSGVQLDPAQTAAVGSLARLREECRAAKERLSAETATVVPVVLPAATTDVRVTRAELEALVADPLAGVLAAIQDLLQRHQIAPAAVSAVATAGGGAAIPLITQRLSEALRAPVVTAPQPQLLAATGAALVAVRDAEAPTGLAPAADLPTGMAPAVAPDAPTGMAPQADQPTSMSPAAWAAGAAGMAATESAADGSPSATFRALAWSEDQPGAEPVPYDGPEYVTDPVTGVSAARPAVEFTGEPGGPEAEPAPLPWYRRPPILFAAAAAALLAATGGLAVTLTGNSTDSTPVTQTATEYSTEPPPEQPAPPQTITVTGSDGQPSTTVVPPPETTRTTTTSYPSSTTTTTTTTTPTTTTTTTTPTTTTTTTTTTTPTTTRTTTQTTTAPPTTSAAPPPTTTAAPEPTITIDPDPDSGGGNSGGGNAGGDVPVPDAPDPGQPVFTGGDDADA